MKRFLEMVLSNIAVSDASQKRRARTLLRSVANGRSILSACDLDQQSHQSQPQPPAIGPRAIAADHAVVESREHGVRTRVEALLALDCVAARAYRQAWITLFR